MNDAFLSNIMRVAFDATKAERAFAVDSNMTVVGTLNMSPEQVEAPYIKCVQKAISQGKPIITDNYTMTIDPSKAPVTNQSFPKLRFVVVLPVKDHGAVCLDQSLREGVTSKDKVDKLATFINHVLDHQQTDADEDELIDLYNAMP
jgi:hypothetical protein